MTPIFISAINKSSSAAKLVADKVIDLLLKEDRTDVLTVQEIGLTQRSSSSLAFLTEQKSFRLTRRMWGVALLINNVLPGLTIYKEGKKSLQSMPALEKLIKPIIPIRTGFHVQEQFFMQFLNRFIGRARTDRDFKWVLLQLARFLPVGVILVIIATLHCAMDLKGITKYTDFLSTLSVKTSKVKTQDIKSNDYLNLL